MKRTQKLLNNLKYKCNSACNSDTVLSGCTCVISYIHHSYIYYVCGLHKSWCKSIPSFCVFLWYTLYVTILSVPRHQCPFWNGIYTWEHLFDPGYILSEASSGQAHREKTNTIWIWFCCFIGREWSWKTQKWHRSRANLP